MFDTKPTHNDFHSSLRSWRKIRKLSQLELALNADVSQRHISWLETGRSQPSREMIVRLSDAMDVPLRDRNHLLNAAGFTNIYSEKTLDEPSMAPISNILSEMLKHHEPYPAYVLDRHWNIKMKNSAADVLFEMTENDPEAIWQAVGDDGNHNLALLSIHPNGLRQFITNWDEFISLFMRRLRKEAMESNDETIMQAYQGLAEYAGDMPEENFNDPLLPVISLDMNLGGIPLSLCSVISTFGTAQDITTDELRIETFYPANEATARFFKE